MPRYHGGVAPAADLGGDRDTVRRDVARGTGIGQHRRIRGDIIAAPWAKDQARGLDDRTFDLQQFGTGLELRDHRFPRSRFVIRVMAGLDPAIHVLPDCGMKDVDARHKAGHDDLALGNLL